MNQTLKTIGFQVSVGILVCASALTSTAQNSRPLSKIYLQTGAGGGTNKSNDFDLGLKTVLNNKWSVTLSYKSLEMKPKNMPSDYQPETGYLFFIPYTYDVTTAMTLVSITAGKYFTLGKNFWATTEGGLSYVKGEKVNFDPTQSTTSSIIIVTTTSSNYNITKQNRSTAGAMFQADVNWAFTSFMGLGAGVYANVNSVQSPVGFNVKLLIGKMGREKKHKP